MSAKDPKTMTQDDLEELLVGMEGAANMLRGMTLDPAIPKHAKNTMKDKIEVLERLVEQHIEQ